MSELKVELVAADRRVWKGEAKFVRVRTTEGDVGILPGHAPLLAALRDGDILIEGTDGRRNEASIGDGFLSVDHDGVTIVAQSVDAPSLQSPTHA